MTNDRYVLNEHLKNYVEKLEVKEKVKKENLNKAKKKYKEDNCSSVQCFLNKDLVSRFKEKTKELNISQTSVIRNAIEVFLENN